MTIALTHDRSVLVLEAKMRRHCGECVGPPGSWRLSLRLGSRGTLHLHLSQASRHCFQTRQIPCFHRRRLGDARRHHHPFLLGRGWDEELKDAFSHLKNDYLKVKTIQVSFSTESVCDNGTQPWQLVLQGHLETLLIATTWCKSDATGF